MEDAVSLRCTSTWYGDPMFTMGNTYPARKVHGLWSVRDDGGNIRFIPKDTLRYITGHVLVSRDQELPRYARFEVVKVTRYAHTYTLAFTVETPVADPFEVPESELRDAAMRRIAELNGIHEWSEASQPVDTYEVVD